MGQVNGTGGDFRPNSSETPGPIFMKLQIYNYFPDRLRNDLYCVEWGVKLYSLPLLPRVQNFRELCRRGWSGLYS